MVELVVVSAMGRSELVLGSTVELAVVEVACTADTTALASEVVTSEDEESAPLEDDEDAADVLTDAGTSATLVPVEVRLAALCLCLCP